MVEKSWLRNYPSGVAAEIDENEFDSIRDVFEQSVKKFKDKIAFSNVKTKMTYAELDALSCAYGAYLQSLPGMKKGDRVAIMLPNCLQYPVALFGALRAGFVIVNINPLYTPRELEHQLKDSGAKAIIVFENFAHTLESVIDRTSVEHIVVTSMGEMHAFFKRVFLNFVVRRVKKLVKPYNLPLAINMQKALQLGRLRQLEWVPLGLEDLAFLQYTGGTTGLVKGAMLSNRNIIANLQQASAWLNGLVKDGCEVVITALPMYHIFCLSANVLVFMKHGGHLFLITNPRDMKTFVKVLKGVPFSVFTGVNTLFNGLLNTSEFTKLDFSHLKISLGGGAAIQRAVADRWEQVTKNVLSEAYGLTECSPAVCINPFERAFDGSIGLPLPSTLVSIRDDDFIELPYDTEGELCVKGPQVMRGYWNSPKATGEVLTKDGWLKTGDIAKMNKEGYCYITDRKKDMILVSGFNVYPNEIEDVVACHPEVLECAAVGVKDEGCGEAVKLFVVRKSASLTHDILVQHCKKSLTGYKVPKHIEFRDELPKSPVGKVLRRELRDR